MIELGYQNFKNKDFWNNNIKFSYKASSWEEFALYLLHHKIKENHKIKILVLAYVDLFMIEGARNNCWLDSLGTSKGPL